MVTQISISTILCIIYLYCYNIYKKLLPNNIYIMMFENICKIFDFSKKIRSKKNRKPETPFGYMYRNGYRKHWIDAIQ